MAANAGSITYDVEVNTADILKAEAVIDKSIRGIVDDFNKADKEVRDFEKSQESLGRTINSVGQIFDKNGRVIADASNQYRKLSLEANKFHASALKQSKISSSVSTGIAGIGRNAGQAGIQLQQFIGQIQGGQSAALAFSQQSADLGFVLGFPLAGAISGIVASLAGMLIPSLLDGKSASDKLTEALEALKNITTETDEGVLVLSDSIEKLAKKSESAAKVELALGIVKAKEAVAEAKKEVNEATKSWEGFFGIISTTDAAVAGLKSLDDAAKRTGETQIDLLKRLGDSYEGSLIGIAALSSATKDIGEEFGITQTQALGLVKVIGDFKDEKSPESIERLAVAVSTLAINTEKPNKKLIELAKRINSASISASNAQEVISLLESALGDLGTALETSSESSDKKAKSVNNLVKALEIEAETLGFTDRALALHTAFLEGATQADYDAINAAFDKIEVHKAETEAIKAKAAAQRKADAESKTLSGQVQGVAGGLLTPTEQLQAQLMERQTILQAAHEQELIAEQEFLELKRRANEQYVEGLKAIDEQALGNQKNQLDKLGVSWDAFGAQAAGAMTGVITGATDADDALRSMAMTILNQLVGALITMGIQSVIGQTTAAATGAATAAALSTAYAPAAAMASLASFGANAAPAAAGIASTVALSQGLALSGGRQFGGGVNANSAYRVGEAGPEIFQTQSGKNIMLPGENGKVLSNSDSMDAMGGGDVSVIVENYGAPASATITQDFSEGQRKVIVKMIGQETSRQISENTGPIAKSLKSSTSTTMKANR